MMVNGRDPLIVDGKPQSILPGKGKQHLMRLLETLARVGTIEDAALVPLIQRQRYRLAWGTTLIVITGRASDDLLNELYQARRSGQNAILILTGRDISEVSIRQRAEFFRIPVVSIASERDLSIWTKEAKRT
jgi:hypothetical protein